MPEEEFAVSEARSSAKRRITIDDLYAFHLVGSPDLSPDGARCVVTVQRSSLEKNTYFSDLQLIDLESGEVRALTEGDYSDSSPAWSPDGRTIAFVSSRTDASEIHLMPMEGGDSRRLTRLEGKAIHDFAWAPDGSALLALLRECPPEDSKNAQEERAKRKLSSPVRSVEGVMYRMDGVGFFGDARPQLYRIDAATGDGKQLTRLKCGVDAFAVAPDGSEIACLVTPDELRHWETILQVIPSCGGKPRVITTPVGPKGALCWSPDGQWLAYLGYEAAEDPWGCRNDHAWVVAADGSEPARDLTPRLDATLSDSTLGDLVGAGRGGLHFGEDSASVDVFVAERGSTRVMRVPLAGGARRVLVDGHVHAYAKTREVGGRLVVTVQTPTNPGDAYLVLPGKRGAPRPLTSLNAALLGSLSLTEPEERWVECEETGRRVQAWVLRPPGFRAGTKYPMLLEIHGGPHLQYGAGFFHEMHWLAAQGWVVVFSNPAGSQGYGEKHLQALRHHWGEADFPELMALVDGIVAEGYVDPKRLGVTGGSYGGYMTNWVVAHTDRFRVAATQRCVSNLVSMAGSSDFPFQADGYFGGNPWSEPDELWRLSPIRLVERIRTPLLILHSEGDLRCNIEQAEQLYSALKVLRRKTKFVRFPREASHGLSRGGPPDLRTRRLEELTAWLASGLSPR